MLLQAVNYHFNEKVAWAIQYVPHDLYPKKKVAATNVYKILLSGQCRFVETKYKD